MVAVWIWGFPIESGNRRLLQINAWRLVEHERTEMALARPGLYHDNMPQPRIAPHWYLSGEAALPKPHEYYRPPSLREKRPLQRGATTLPAGDKQADAQALVPGAPHHALASQAGGPPSLTGMIGGREYLHPTVFHRRLGQIAGGRPGAPRPTPAPAAPATAAGIQQAALS